MDVEASIAERLQKLRQWQIEQQERLLKQQQMQRKILSQEQNLIFKALGLQIQDLNVTESTENMHGMEIDMRETMSDETSMLQYNMSNSDDALEMTEKEIPTNINVSCGNCKEEEIEDHISTIVDKNRNSMKDYGSSMLSQKKKLSSDLLIEGIKPLSSDAVSNRRVSIDDIPLPSPKKDFQALLEERLRRELEVMSNKHTVAQAKPKRPFLKKGQGLSRYKMSINSHTPLTTKKHGTSSSSNARLINKSNKKSNVCKNVLSESSNNVPVANGKQQSNLKNISLPRNRILNKSESITPIKRTTCSVASDRMESLPEMNTSDIDSKAERELEEVRIFELLEEKAENSSFCSTSSTVLAFLQQSTPFKIKKRSNCAGSGGDIAASTKRQNDRQASDTIERERTVQRSAYVGNTKPGMQRRFEQLNAHKGSHISAATINSYWDTIDDDTQEEIQKHLKMANQVLRSDEAHVDHSEGRDTSIASTFSSDSDGERDILPGNDRDLARDSEADANHRVRFSEYNEYRTIDLTDVSDAADESPLTDYTEQQDWDDRSVDTSELSDNEEKPSLNYREQMSSLKVTSNEQKAFDTSRLSLQQDITSDSYCRIMKTANVRKEKEEEEENIQSKEDSGEYVSSDNECTPIIEDIVQISDDEQSISSLSSSSSLSCVHRKSNTQRKEYVPRSEPNKIMEKISKICLNTKKVDSYPSEDRTNTFEPELLKSRLLELEKEIDIFRKESAALLLQRRKLQEDQTLLHKEYMEKERTFKDNKRRIQNQLEEEKKKLTREKVAMENRIRDAQEKARQNKMERQRVQDLQEQLEKLKDELNIKESRWNATESRYKSELRVLRAEISKLKQEITNLQNVRRTNVRNIKKNTNGQAITKAINQINKRIIAAPLKESSTKMPRNLSGTSPDTSVRDDNDNDRNKDDNKSIELVTKAINVGDFEQIEDDISVNKIESKQVGIESQPKCDQKFAENVAKKKRNLYENLLKDATLDLMESENSFYVRQDMSDFHQPIITQMQNSSEKSNEMFGKGNDKSCFSSTNENVERTTHVASNEEYSTDRSRELNQDSDKDDIRMRSRISSPEKKSSTLHFSSRCHQTNNSSTKDIIKEIQYSDGRMEYWYPNGNVKKIFPDRGVTKMIYYNGDVRETDKDGRIRYFYATTRTWHTTTPDGLEILEFSDGQVEKRMSDGTVEVSFPDGVIRIAQADGTEKWSLPDGTVAQTFINGDKILVLPNGQREIHTKAHKRREYPDGTVKLIYADGTQETRYSSGRKRLRDKDGNLLMDSYDS